jgi:hypothetical protein
VAENDISLHFAERESEGGGQFYKERYQAERSQKDFEEKER